jgi:hypothetical protein
MFSNPKSSYHNLWAGLYPLLQVLKPSLETQGDSVRLQSYGPRSAQQMLVISAGTHHFCTCTMSVSLPHLGKNYLHFGCKFIIF